MTATTARKRLLKPGAAGRNKRANTPTSRVEFGRVKVPPPQQKTCEKLCPDRLRITCWEVRLENFFTATSTVWPAPLGRGKWVLRSLSSLYASADVALIASVFSWLARGCTPWPRLASRRAAAPIVFRRLSQGCSPRRTFGAVRRRAFVNKPAVSPPDLPVTSLGQHPCCAVKSGQNRILRRLISAAILTHRIRSKRRWR